MVGIWLQLSLGKDGAMNQRENGVYYTCGNPFLNPAFEDWSQEASLPDKAILEPFAGSNNLIEMLRGMGLCNLSRSYDISPANEEVRERDSLASFPTGYEVCVTNPPWLARNSASFRNLPFPDTKHDDLYKYALEQCLNHCGHVAALIPESFIRASLFEDRLSHFVSLTGKIFRGTDNPVGLALFSPRSKEALVWRDSNFIGELSWLKSLKPSPRKNGLQVEFNRNDGNVGFIAIDNTKEASIRFCEADEVDCEVKSTSRAITKILVDGEVRIGEWNEALNDLRARCQDVLLTSFKGVRKDGRYRRRCDWDLARGIIQNAS